MDFHCDRHTISLQPTTLIVAGWTGRNPEAVQHHIDELKALGIAPPSAIPLFYQVSPTLLTQHDHIAVLGKGTSGEVEPLLLHTAGEYWIGLASDHTDRDLEAYSVAASKQACPKPCARELWRFADVEAHLDELSLSCDIEQQGQWVPYQSGQLSSIRPLQELLQTHPVPEDAAMLCGTLPAIGGVRPANHVRMALEDPVRHRRIELTYRITELTIVE